MTSVASKAGSFSTVDVAVVVPVYRNYLSLDERISLAHLEHWLGRYDKFLLKPRGLELELPNFQYCEFDTTFFESIDGYSKLLLTRDFYQAFEHYAYVLIYQLDALAFSDTLLEWCNLGYDYIGSPWLKSNTIPSLGFSGVGNGGFSLRKIQTFLKVFDSQRPFGDPPAFLKDFLTIPDAYPSQASKLRRLLSRIWSAGKIYREGVPNYIKTYKWNEDLFWASRAKAFVPDFKIPSPDVALKFAFEKAPSYCYSMNNYSLPFGCHGWPKYEREFWQSYLLQPED